MNDLIKVLHTPVVSQPYPLGITPADRLWLYIDQGEPDDCWEWTGSRAQGYGRIRIDGHNYNVSRLILLLAGIEIPDGSIALHSCDNPPCCNLRHLRVGTKKDNTQDALDRGRMAIGERCGKAILTNEQVSELRRLYAEGAKAVDLASMFGINRVTVYPVVSGRTWGNLDAPTTLRGRPCGEQINTNKLTPVEVVEIRARAASGESARSLARCYGMSKTTILDIIHLKIWRHVP